MRLILGTAVSEGGWQATGFFSGLVTLTGVWLRWRSHAHCSAIEEAVKNGKISPEDAQRRIRLVARRAAVLTFGGLGLLAVATIALCA